jgi:hypothetical protein
MMNNMKHTPKHALNAKDADHVSTSMFDTVRASLHFLAWSVSLAIGTAAILVAVLM